MANRTVDITAARDWLNARLDAPESSDFSDDANRVLDVALYDESVPESVVEWLNSDAGKTVLSRMETAIGEHMGEHLSAMVSIVAEELACADLFAA